MDNLLKEFREKGFIVLSEENIPLIKDLLDAIAQLPEELKNQTFLTEIPDEKVSELLDGRHPSELTAVEALELLEDHAPEVVAKIHDYAANALIDSKQESELVEGEEAVESVEDEDYTPNPETKLDSESENSGVSVLGVKRVWSASLSKFVTVEE